MFEIFTKKDPRAGIRFGRTRRLATFFFDDRFYGIRRFFGHLVQAGLRAIGEAVFRPTLPIVAQQSGGKFHIKLALIEGRRQHFSGIGLSDVACVTADIRGEDRQPSSDSLQQYRAGIFHIGRVHQKITGGEQLRYVGAPSHKLHLAGDAQFMRQTKIRAGLILTNDNEPRGFGD